MKFLIDQALSPAVAIELNAPGTTPSTSASSGLHAASDQAIFDHTARDHRVVASAATDFGTLLAIRKQTAPSVMLFRHGSQHRPTDQAALLKANLPPHCRHPPRRSIVVIHPTASESEHYR